MATWKHAAFALLALIQATNAIFYLPGVPPVSFQTKDPVKLYVNKLTSTKTQVPYDYYHLPYCRPAIHEEAENLGEVLTGDRIENSLYRLEMKVPAACRKVCKASLTDHQARKFRKAIDEDYRVHWIVDNLPAAVEVPDPLSPTNEPYLQRGFPVGFKLGGLEEEYLGGGGGGSSNGKPQHYLYNHVRIRIQYNEAEELLEAGGPPKEFEGARITGFVVEPYSVRHEWEGEYAEDGTTVLSTCNEMNHVSSASANFQGVDGGAGDVVFTYDVVWERSATPWAHRWDVYLRGHPQDRVHWFSIANSTLIVLFLTALVGMILFRSLHRDIAQYNEASVEDAKEEAGWKLVHADVFRAPTQRPMLYAALVGTGSQLGAMAVVLMLLALLGFLSPANRGSLLTAFVLLFVFMGAVAGHQSARLYKTFRGQRWKTCTYLVALGFPGAAFAVFFVVNAALAAEGSTGAVPFGTLFTLLVLWFGISTPLVFLGSYLGYRKDPLEFPVRTNQIPRQIPPQPWYLNAQFAALVCGVLPFGAVSVELFFIMSALWLHQVYYIFGFLFLTLCILAATCVELTMVLAYFQLCAEDYRWWWRCFCASGSCAAYLLLYGVWYFATQLDVDSAAGTLVYFGYMALIAAAFFLMTGTVGHYGALWFLRKIYASIKVD